MKSRSETNLVAKIRNLFSRGKVRLFRNNVGQAWMGRSEYIKYDCVKSVNRGDVIIRHASPVKFGVGGEGASDLLGAIEREITPDMVGSTMAQVISLEVKTKRGKLTKEQEDWLNFVSARGGLAAHVSSLEEVEAFLKVDE